MKWIKAKAGDICSECGEDTYEGGEDIAKADNELFCEGCWEEVQDDFESDNSSEDCPIDGVEFADLGGESSLRAATDINPRNLPCPSCKTPNVLTPLDRAAGYQCDQCANRDERDEY